MALHPTIAANVQIPGVGASLRQRWPTTQTNVGASNMAKFGASPVQSMTNYGAGPVLQALFAGAACASLGSTGAGNYSGRTFNTNISFFTERVGGPVLDEWSCWSLRLAAAYPALAVAIDMDVGIVLGCGGTSSSIYQTVNGEGATLDPGLIFGPIGNGRVGLRARATAGGALTINETVALALTPDLTKFNTYEVQFITGSDSTDPVLFGLINGQVVTGRYALTAAAGLFPGPASGSGTNMWGYSFNFGNRTGGVYPLVYYKEAVLTAAISAAFLF